MVDMLPNKSQVLAKPSNLKANRMQKPSAPFGLLDVWFIHLSDAPELNSVNELRIVPKSRPDRLVGDKLVLG